MAGRFLIYGLTDPRTGEIRYVGKSTTGLTRPRQHYPDGTYKGNWIANLRAAGLHCGVLVLEELSVPEALNEAERRWIAFGRAQRWRLTNLTDGGDGALGLRVPRTDEWRRNIGAALRGRKHREEQREANRRGHLGQVVTEEHRAKLRAAHKGRQMPLEVREKLSLALAGRTRAPLTAGHRAKISDRNRGHIVTATTRAKIGAARSRRVGHTLSESHRANIAAALKGRKRGRYRVRPRMRINLMPSVSK